VIGIKFKSNFDAKKLERSVERMLGEIQQQTFKTARSLTPVRSGYAKSQWKQNKTRSGFKVSNKVEYMPFLDAGISNQAPKGISKPTVKKMTGYIKSRRLKR